MTEEEYRAEMARQAKLANLIALRALCTQSTRAATHHNADSLDEDIAAMRYHS